MGNPGHSSPHGAVNAKILPEFRETREIQTKNHQLLPSAAACCKGMPGLPAAVERVCWGLCIPQHLPQPHTFTAVSWSPEAGNTDLPGADPPCSAPSPCALWLLLLSKQETPGCCPTGCSGTSPPGHPASLSAPSLLEYAGANRGKWEQLLIPPAQPSRNPPRIGPKVVQGVDSRL